MTTVVMARDYATAADAARLLALGEDWIYPHSDEMLHGMIVPRVVYVEGWLESPALTTATAELVQSRLAQDTQVVLLPRDFTTRAPLRDVLDRQAALSAPFMETVAPEPLQGDPRPSRRGAGTPAWLWVIGVAGGGSMLAALVVTLGRSWGWW